MVGVGSGSGMDKVWLRLSQPIKFYKSDSSFQLKARELLSLGKYCKLTPIGANQPTSNMDEYSVIFSLTGKLFLRKES